MDRSEEIATGPAITDIGPFFHGTKADLPIGALLTAGYNSNYKPEVIMNHIYFTALMNGAGLAAAHWHKVVGAIGSTSWNRPAALRTTRT